MDKKCDACEFLKKPQNQILEAKYWCVGIGDNHAYLGRAFITLRSHKAKLGELNNEEWQEFQDIIGKLEVAYKQSLGAEPLNVGCFMNHAFRTDPANPHVHWHVYPRYKKAPEIDGVAYDDPLFGNFYDDNATRIVSDKIVEKIATKLRETIKKL